MPEKTIKFQIRDKSHKILGTYLEEEVLKAIQAGRYTGEEEVCVTGSPRWQRLASHPHFYDEFLKRVLGTSYDLPQEEASQKGEKIESADPNLGLTAHEKEISEKAEPPAKKKREKGSGLTLRESEIQSLFKSGVVEKTEVVSPDFQIPSKEEEQKSLPKIAIRLEESAEVKQEKNETYRTVDRRRFVMWAAVLVLLLVSLFNLGRSDEPVAMLDKGPAKLASLEAPDFKIPNEAFELFADLYVAQDNLPAYQSALQVLKTADEGQPNPLPLIKLKAEVLSHLLTDGNSGENTLDLLKAEIKKGKNLDPQASDFYRAEATILLHEKKIPEAKKAAALAKEANPADPKNALLQAEVALASRDYSDAKVFLEEAAMGKFQTVRLKRLLAETNFGLHLPNETVEAAEACVSQSPAQAECYYYMAEGHAALGQLKQARAFSDLAARLVPFVTREKAEKFLRRSGDLEKTLGTEESVKKVDTVIAALKSTGNDSNLKKEYESFVVNESFFVAKGKEALKESRGVSAKKYFIAALSLDRHNQEATLALGALLEKEIKGINDYKTLEAYYLSSILLDNQFAKAYVRLGALQTEQYNFEKAMGYFSRALHLNSQDPDAYVELGKHYYKRQDYLSAFDALANAKQNNSQSSDLYYYIGLVRQKIDRTKIREAMESFYLAYSIDPENYDALSEWLKLKVVSSEKAFALKFLKSLQAADPKNPEMIRVMGELYLANSEARRAIQYFHRTLDIDNRSSKTRMSLGRALENIGELDTAAEEFHEASRLDPRNADGYYEAARVLFQLQNYPKMAIVVKKLLDLAPNYPGSHKLASLVSQAQGNKELAISEMKQEVKNNPENYSFVIEFAELYMRYGQYKEAVVELSKITNLPSENSADKAKAAQYVKVRLTAYYLLSGCYRLMAKPDLAEGAVKLGLSIDTENPLLRRELCFVYSDLQRFPEATRECESYLRRNPAAEDAERIKKKLREMNVDYY